MSIYTNNIGFKKGEGFSSAKGVAICGFTQNRYETAQAKVGSVALNTLLPCTPVIINNDSTPTAGRENLAGLNPTTFVISKVAAAQNDIVDGFILESTACIEDENGNGGLPIPGGVVDIALIGSGARVFLPADDGLANKPLSTVLYWDATNLKLTATSGSNVKLEGVRMVSSVVKGKRRKLNVSTVEWEDVSCVEVRL